METTTEPGPNDIPLDPPILGQRFIQTLHVPNQAEWYGSLVGMAYLRGRNTDQPIIDQALIDDLLEQERAARNGKRKRA